MRVQPVPTGGLPVAFHITTWGHVPTPVSTSGPRSVQPGEYLPQERAVIVQGGVDLVEAPPVLAQRRLDRAQAGAMHLEHLAVPLERFVDPVEPDVDPVQPDVDPVETGV